MPVTDMRKILSTENYKGGGDKGGWGGREGEGERREGWRERSSLRGIYLFIYLSV